MNTTRKNKKFQKILIKNFKSVLFILGQPTPKNITYPSAINSTPIWIFQKKLWEFEGFGCGCCKFLTATTPKTVQKLHLRRRINTATENVCKNEQNKSDFHFSR